MPFRLAHFGQQVCQICTCAKHKGGFWLGSSVIAERQAGTLKLRNGKVTKRDRRLLAEQWSPAAPHLIIVVITAPRTQPSDFSRSTLHDLLSILERSISFSQFRP